MYFRATPTNMTELLVVCLAPVAIFMLLRKKYDSNIPLLFYSLAAVFTNAADRQVQPAILYGGMAFCLLLRFEFMGSAFSKMIAFLATTGLAVMTWIMMSDVIT
jgi:hypothetical protein